MKMRRRSAPCARWRRASKSCSHSSRYDASLGRRRSARTHACRVETRLDTVVGGELRVGSKRRQECRRGEHQRAMAYRCGGCSRGDKISREAVADKVIEEAAFGIGG